MFAVEGRAREKLSFPDPVEPRRSLSGSQTSDSDLFLLGLLPWFLPLEIRILMSADFCK